MVPKGGIMLGGLLFRFHSEEGRALYRYLPAKERVQMETLSVPKDLQFGQLFSADKWMEPLHYSWFAAFLETLPPALLLATLPRKQGEALAKTLRSIPEKKSLSPFLRTYLSSYLKDLMQKNAVLPTAHLPPSDLNDLFSLSKPELLHLIDLLGIHDLAAELRHVVDKMVLTKIYGVLTQEQRHFCHYCSKQPMPWVPPKLNITAWDNEKRSLNILLHQRGLFRLAKALTLEDPSMRWHLCHRLDVGRGQIVIKHMKEKYDPALIPYFKNQVVHLLKRYQQKVTAG